jgi:7-carboxy-7-deazaguanine synthase
VVATRNDYDWAKEMITAHELNTRCDVVLSPVAGQLNPTDLAEWILADALDVRFQIQLHKLLWSDARGK